MPIYEYHCSQCGKEFEFMQKFSDPPKTVCPECGGELKKLISQCTFHLKGTGWYATDYAHKNTSSQTTKKNHHSESGTKAETAKKPEKKTDTPS